MFQIFLPLFLTAFFFLNGNISPCSEKSLKIVEGNSMSPLIKNGDEIFLLQNYYECTNEKPKNGDLVAYDFAGENHALIKIIRATDKDSLEIKDENLFINSEVMENSAGDIYFFNENEQKMLSLYISDGRLPENSYFIFGDNINVSTDSRKFGAVSVNDFWGKFELKEKK